MILVSQKWWPILINVPSVFENNVIFSFWTQYSIGISLVRYASQNPYAWRRSQSTGSLPEDCKCVRDIGNQTSEEATAQLVCCRSGHTVRWPTQVLGITLPRMVYDVALLITASCGGSMDSINAHNLKYNVWAVFEVGVSLYSLVWLRTPNVDQAGFELMETYLPLSPGCLD